MINKQCKKKNSILICGAYGMGNVGDESILESIVSEIKALVADASFTVISRNPKETEALHNLKAIQTFDMPAVHKAMAESEVFISGGGTLIQNNTSNRSLYYYLYTLLAAKKRGCKVIMYGCGIGPVSGSFHQKLSASVINKNVDSISLRDNNSLKTLREYGVTLSDIKITADPAFSLTVRNKDKVLTEMQSFGIDQNTRYICFALRNWKGFEEKISAFAKAADYAYEKYNLLPVFFNVNKNTDIATAEKVGKLMNAPYRIANGFNGSSMALMLMSGAEAVISVRLHSLIFAASVGSKFGAISYDPKVKSIMEYLGNDSIIELSDVDEQKLKNLIDKVLLQDPAQNKARAQQLHDLEKENPALIAKALGFGNKKTETKLTKLAFFQSDFRVGGIQKSLVNILENLDYSKYEADVYYFDEETFFKLPQNPNLHYIPCKPYNYLSRIVPFRLQLAFHKAPSDKEYDIAIDFNSYRSECSVAAVKTKASKRIMWIHNDVKIKRANEPKYRVLWFFFKGKYRYFDEFAAVSPGIVDAFREETHTPVKPIYVIPNHIDTNEIKAKLGEMTEFKPDDSKINVCSCGRLCHQKGYDLLLPEFAKAIKKQPLLMLYLIGDGPDKEALQALAKSLGIENNVVFLGNQKNPFIYESKMDAFVLTSRYEGQGMVIWEAKSVGLPVIISKNLEKYNPGIPGTDDVAKALANAAKTSEKTFDDLKEYNDAITLSIDKLLS